MAPCCARADGITIGCMIDGKRVPGSLVVAVDDGRLVGVDDGGRILWLGDDDGRSDLWTYRNHWQAMNALLIWRPGTVAVCALCGREQGGDDPPGDWIRHQPSNRRRLPICDARRPGVYGWLHYVRP